MDADDAVLDRFEAAMTTPDPDALAALLAPDVVLHSPTKHRPFRGGAHGARVLAAVVDVIEGLHYVRRLGPTAAVFAGTVHPAGGGAPVELQGVDLLELDEVGRIVTLTIMVRPLSGLTALSEAMGARIGLTSAAVEVSRP